MSDPELSPFAAFLAVWKDAFTKVFTQLGAASVEIDDGNAAPLEQAKPGDAEALLALFGGSGCLAGELQWSAPRTVAVQCAQLLMSEPIDPSVPFSDTHSDGFLEFLRQVAAEAALAWKEAKGAVAELVFQTEAKGNVRSQTTVTIAVKTDKCAELRLRLDLNAEMEQSLAFDQKTEPQSVTEPEGETGASVRLPLPSNLDLLLDVQLDATIRFGEREMLLQDVFGLMPGAVVELDQLVNEPAELLVAGRLVARGEVVVVEGNFGLRVTEVASAAQRAVALSLS